MFSNEDARKVMKDIQGHVNRIMARLDIAEEMGLEYIDPETPAFESFLEDAENVQVLVKYFDYQLRKSA